MRCRLRGVPSESYIGSRLLKNLCVVITVVASIIFLSRQRLHLPNSETPVLASNFVKILPEENCRLFDLQLPIARSIRHKFPCGVLDLYPLWISSVVGSITLAPQASDACVQLQANRTRLHADVYRAQRIKNVSRLQIVNISSSARNTRHVPPVVHLLRCGRLESTTSSRSKRENIAVVVTDDWTSDNLWHALAQMHAVWQALHLVGLDKSDAKSAVVFVNSTGGNAFAQTSSWPLLARRMFSHSISKQRNCFKRVVWVEGHYIWPGELWQLAHRAPWLRQCSAHSMALVRKNFRWFQQALHRAVYRVGAVESEGSWVSSIYPSSTRTTLCYLDRQHYHKRTFSSDVHKAFLEGSEQFVKKRGWALHVANFTAETPKLEQVRRMASCDVMIGAHGAGFAYQIWSSEAQRLKNGKAPQLLVELSKGKCKGYYVNMAFLLRHGHKCLNIKSGVGIQLERSQIVGLNVTDVFEQMAK